MATLLTCDAVFLHVPKTGGMYVRRLLQSMNLIRFDFSRDHSDMEHTLHTSKYYPGNYYLRSLQLRGNLDTYVGRCSKFCVVRNPVDWYVSYWRFMCDHNWRTLAPTQTRTRFGFRYDQWHPLVALEKFAGNDFNLFVKGVVSAYPEFLSQMFAAYADPSHITYIAKQETLIEDMKRIFDQLKVPYTNENFNKPGRVNQSITQQPVCSSSSRELIFKSEEQAFLRYGYTFQDNTGVL